MIFPTMLTHLPPPYILQIQTMGVVGLGILQILRQVKWEHYPPLLLTHIPSLAGNSQDTPECDL